jgi:hypothetical protein
VTAPGAGGLGAGGLGAGGLGAGGLGAGGLGAGGPGPGAGLPATVRRALIVGLDGVRADRLASARAPVLHALACRGLSGCGWLHAPPEAMTSSAPGWATVLTGRWPGRHGVTDNDLDPAAADRRPDLLGLARAGQPGLRTLAAAAWAPLVGPARGGPLLLGAQRRLLSELPDPAARDRQVVDAAAAALAGGAVDLAFVHLDQVDAAGHATGVGAAYAAAIEAADAELGRLLAAVEHRAGEDWLIVVTTDHGQADSGGHGAGTEPERRWWVVAAGGGLPAGSTAAEPRPVDVAPTVLAHLGISTVDSMDGEGLAATRPHRSWDGWARSGWRLAPAQTWLAGHGFGRGRGLLAVAEASTVDAVLTAPPLPPGPATLVFDCHLQPAAGQQAEITVGPGPGPGPSPGPSPGSGPGGGGGSGPGLSPGSGPGAGPSPGSGSGPGPGSGDGGGGGGERLLWRGGGELVNARVRVPVPAGRSPGRLVRWRLRAAGGRRAGCWAVTRPEIS